MLKSGLKASLLTLLVIWVGGMLSGNRPLIALPGGSLMGQSAAPQGTVVVPEGNDYATRVLRDPWDMQNFSDVSEYLNRSDQSIDLRNVSMTDGMFTAQSASGDANFAALFPGYETASKLDRDGALHPILSSIYKCLYVAIDVQSSSTDLMQIFWFGDDKLNGGSHWAQSGGIPVQANIMYLYSYNLATPLPPFPPPETPWTSWPTWEGLRLDPTLVPNTNFQVDWIRLTDCNPVDTTVTWSTNIGNAAAIKSVWLRQVGTKHDVLVKRGLDGNSGSTTLDVQGIQAGTYTVGLGTSTTCCIENANDQLVVNQAPVARFVRPSYTSGADYASQNGNPWDFADSSDTNRISGMQTSTHDSLFDMTTQSGPNPGGADPRVFLNAPQPVNGAVYRYLTYRMFTEWVKPWQNVPDAMIVRWIWTILGVSGQPASRCFLVGQAMPFDVGWHVYTIDLHDPFNGSPENTSGTDCPAQLPSWSSSPPILDLRFDPNENNTVAKQPIGGPIHQQLDWIRLTAMDQVARGTPYELQVNLNRPPSDVSAVHYYYTTDPSDPTQSPARQFLRQTGGGGPFHIFLPLLQRAGAAQAVGDTLLKVDLNYMWDTSNVSPNTYYLCLVVTTGPNTATYCSDAPIQVV